LGKEDVEKELQEAKTNTKELDVDGAETTAGFGSPLLR